MPEGKHSNAPQGLRSETATANDGRVTWPVLALAATALMLGVFNAAHHLALNEQLLLSGAVLVGGSVLTALATVWNWVAGLQAEKQRLEQVLASRPADDAQADSKRHDGDAGP